MIIKIFFIFYRQDVDPNHLQLLLTYMYRGEVDVGEEHLTDFLKTASGLRVRGLTETDRAGDTVRETAPVAPIPLINHDLKRKSVEMTQLPQVRKIFFLSLLKYVFRSLL